MDGDAFPGTSATSFAFIGGLSISQAFLVAPLISKFAPRLGTRPLLAFGVLLEGSSFIAASFAEDIWQLFLSQGICFGWGMGLLYTGTVGILPQWFDKRSGLANALASAGSGFGGLAYALAAERLIQQLGIPWTMRILGIICFAANGIATCLVRDRISRDGVKSSLVDIAMLRNLSLDRRLLFGVFSILAYVVCLFSLPTFASSIGLSNQQGSLSAALLSLGQAIGRPLVGLACDKIGTERAGVIASLISALLTLCLWTNTASYAALLAFSMLVGTTA
jgi:MFS family permease